MWSVEMGLQSYLKDLILTSTRSTLQFQKVIRQQFLFSSASFKLPMLGARYLYRDNKRITLRQIRMLAWQLMQR